MANAKGRKSIFITGAASGIGAETARLFARKGWFVGLYDIDTAGLDQMETEIGPDNCTKGELDVRDRAHWTRSVQAFSAATEGRMNVLFNNAGVARHGWFEDIMPEDSDWIVDVNVKGVINGVYASLPLLRDTNEARVINVASMAGVVGSPKLAVYSATKFAVRGLTEALDVEFSELGVSVVSLMPWFIETPILNMTDREGSNHNMKDELEAAGATVYPVSLAAERAWEAAHGKDVHYPVGKEAARAKFASRFMPKGLRKRLKKTLDKREG